MKGSVDSKRRTLLQGAACVGAATFAPAVLSKSLSGESIFSDSLSSASQPALTGQLVCDIADPVKTLVLHNHTDKAIVVEHVAQGSFMFDGSIVDCNGACMAKPITIPANQEVQVRFDRRRQSTLLTPVEEYNRIQSRVARLGDGTRVIPFAAKIKNNVATIV